MGFLFGPGSGGPGGANQEDYDWPANTITTDHTVTESDYNIIVDSSSGNVNITFPDPTAFTKPKREFRVVIKDASNTISIEAASGTLIDGSGPGSPITLFTSKIIISDGSDYYTI